MNPWKPMFFGGLAVASLAVALFTNSEAAHPSRPEMAGAGHHPQQVSPPPILERLQFAGAPLPLERVGVRERMEKELLIGTFRHSSSLLTLKRSGRWFPVIEPILIDSGIPVDFKYLSVIESGLANAVSPSDARGSGSS